MTKRTTPNRYSFPASAVPYAWLVVDNATGNRVPGSVTRGIGGYFTYQLGRWNGERQVSDNFSAISICELSGMIDKYLNQGGIDAVWS